MHNLCLFWDISYFSSVQSPTTLSQNIFKAQKTGLRTIRFIECLSGTHRDPWGEQKINTLTHLEEFKFAANKKAIEKKGTESEFLLITSFDLWANTQHKYRILI